jgi:amino acid transporter
VFALLYLTYKYIHPRSSRVDLRDLTSSHYVLGDLKTIEKEDPEIRNRKQSDAAPSHIDPSAVELESVRDSRFVPTSPPEDREITRAQSSTRRSVVLSPEIQDEIEAERAIKEERERIKEILQKRPARLERGFWRELWSFVVTDKDVQVEHERD